MPQNQETIIIRSDSSGSTGNIISERKWKNRKMNQFCKMVKIFRNA